MEFIETPPPDPAKNRDYFEHVLKRMICVYNIYSEREILNAILSNDTEKLSIINSEKQNCEDEISDFLQQWDIAETYEEKVIVCGLPKRNYKKD